ncbi:MAG: type II secretion system protein GspM [Caulobacter sp.]|nr:type II secretion system protein GspM [Caulobacter sp.]
MSLLQTAHDFWSLRSPRERVMLGGLGVVLAGLLLWFGVLAPLNMAGGWARAERQAAAADLAAVNALARGGATPGATQAAGRGLAGVVDVAAAASGIVIERRREEADGRLTVWIAAVQPRILMQWISGLRSGHGASVVGMSAAKADASSLAVEVTFERTGS